MDKSTKDAILQHGLDRIESYRKVIESIQNGVSEAESCRIYHVNLGKFRRWCRDNYNQENKVYESFMLYDDFFSWQDALMYAVTGDRSIVATSNFDEAWEYVKTTLRDREARVIELRYKESKTLEEVANEFGVSRDAIHKVELGTIRKLKHPRRSEILLYGLRYIDAFEKFKKTTEEQRLQEMDAYIVERLKDRFSSVALELEFDDDSVRNMIVQEALKRAVFINYDLEDLNLSTRTFNCLKRAGIKNMQDVLDYSANKGLSRVRNFGINSFEELQNKFREFGCRRDLIFTKEYL